MKHVEEAIPSESEENHTTRNKRGSQRSWWSRNGIRLRDDSETRRSLDAGIYLPEESLWAGCNLVPINETLRKLVGQIYRFTNPTLKQTIPRCLTAMLDIVWENSNGARFVVPGLSHVSRGAWIATGTRPRTAWCLMERKNPYYTDPGGT